MGRNEVVGFKNFASEVIISVAALEGDITFVLAN